MTSAIDVRATSTSVYPAPGHLALTANVTAVDVELANADPLAFWERAARRLDWHIPWHTTHVGAGATAG